MQPITEILNVLKTKFSDAYVLASSGDVVVETAGRKRGSRASATILCEAEARAQAREIAGDITDEERGALAGLVLFFDFQRRLGEALEEAAILAEIEAEIALEEAVAKTLVVPAVDESAAQTADEAIAELAALADELASLKPLSNFAYQFFHNLGIVTISGLIEALSTPAHYAEWGMHAKDACQALFTHSGGDEMWLERAAIAREASWMEEEMHDRKIDPGQFHGAEEAEVAHVAAKAEIVKRNGLHPIARFVVDGQKYARNLDKGVATEIRQLQTDITKKWGEMAARSAFTTLKVSWA